jgi:hypothetical protein
MDAVCHRCARNAPENVHEYRGILLINQTAISGVQVLSGLRQSMPSSSIESCARVSETVPSVACGQTKRPYVELP